MSSLNDESSDVALPPDEWTPIIERTTGEKLAYLQGVRAGIDVAASLAALYEGQPDIKNRVKRAGGGMADVMQTTVLGNPCAVCGYDDSCGDPPGEDCHS